MRTIVVFTEHARSRTRVRGIPIALAVAAGAIAAIGQTGCESVIPRQDLQLLASTLPPSPEVPPDEIDAIACEIRERTGVSEFEFSDSAFAPEMKLPPGTGWIMGMFIGEQKAGPQ